MQTKTRTKPLRATDYISLAGTANRSVNLTRLVDDAVEALGTIRATCYGAGNGKRSRHVIARSFRSILEAAGYQPAMISQLWREQVCALDELNVNAES